MPEKIIENRSKVFLFVVESYLEHSLPLTRKEIAAGLGWSMSKVNRVLRDGPPAGIINKPDPSAVRRKPRYQPNINTLANIIRGMREDRDRKEYSIREISGVANFIVQVTETAPVIRSLRAFKSRAMAEAYIAAKTEG